MPSFERADYLSWYIPRLSRERRGINLHSSGVFPLRESEAPPAPGDPWLMISLFERRLASWLGLPHQELLFTPGATGGTLLAALTLVDPNEVIAVELPIYEPMLRHAERLGRVRTFHRRQDECWRLDAARVLEELPEQVSLALITEPSNPSGTYADPDEILALADGLASRGGILLINEVYRLYSSTRPSFHGTRENIAVVSSLSKLIGAYWARLGWISAREPLIARLRQAHMTFGMPSQPSAAVGAGLISSIDARVRAAREIAGTGATTVERWVDETAEVQWIAPEGCGFGCLILPPHLGNDRAFAERLHDEHDVLTIPGSFFGVPGSLRISWLQVGDDLEEGLDRIAQAL